ncbi:amino acid transporter, putative [Plasmodium berghei]|uniref:Amino acid transporter, putative n=2 Tax=Plasmodium berghei TaxID=5821 RepID=A0A509AK03_PLABA|nr:amino acid transporter, putative [Plasmodium berghei ANKA]CXI41989.1 amino acid transporter, putative [Plasmodium berghei]SCM22019.1 amino acid transporter, putative [Plasmodium berghei]SCN25231.1 amino acid transporter, putative [Plasmodium berghei]SCO60219.1 amino acid transporter, putative [Plasmodium berghei]SCO61846.1 amino acid transporter, putative [Plasmodium berghei]|eukprot:XP_034421510.1 amino acid transporter, putative [Plasmodium berghei ANKA]
MHKKISSKEHENDANEFFHEKKKKKKKTHKWNTTYTKGSNDLKSYLYSMCINFSCSDIYQEYISRLSLNSYNNCDYDQIRRSCYISKNDFLKYYNFLLYDNNFELEEENNDVDEFSFFFKKPNDSSDIEEVATYLIGKCDGNIKENNEECKERVYNKIKKLILNKYRNKNMLLTMNTSDNSDITEISKKKIYKNEKTDKRKNSINDYNLKSYTLGKLNTNTKNKFYNNCELIKNEENNEKKYFPNVIKKSFFLLRDFFIDKNEISFMSNLNIYFLNYENVSKNEIKNKHNNHYFYMLNNLSKSQNDPSVEMYYNFYNKLTRDKRNKNNDSLKIEDEEIKREVMLDRKKYDENIYGSTKSKKLMKNSIISSKHTHININSVNKFSNDDNYSILSYEGKSEIGMKKENNNENTKRITKNESNLSKTEYKTYRRRTMKRLCSEEIEVYFKKVIKNEIINFNQKRIDNKDKWNTLFSFMFSCIGASLSSHCYLDLSEIKTKFDFFLLFSLIIIFYIFIGLPLLQMEFSLGQISQSSVVNTFSFLKKKYTGIGIITLIITFNILSKNIYKSVDTVIIITNSLKKPLPWQMNHCEKIESKHICIQSERCRWVSISLKSSVQKKIYKGIINSNFQHKINKQNHGFPHLNVQNNPKLLNAPKMECKSIGILEGIHFFSKDICFYWKVTYLLLIMLVLYVLMRIEEMSCNKFLQYSFLFFITNCIFQMIQMYSKICLHCNDRNNIKNNINSDYREKSIFFGEKNLFYINIQFIGKIINIVLISINCSTGINFMFSSYTNIGDNILPFVPYIILGSLIGIVIHLGYYYLCISIIIKYGNVYDSIELNNLLMGLKMLPINYNSFEDFFKKEKKVIKNKIIYFIALSKMNLPNIMTFTYFLSSLLLLLISCSIHLKGILLILKESKKLINYKKKIISIFIIILYFFIVFFIILFPMCHNINLLIDSIISNYIYFFVIFLQLICVTWIYNFDSIQKFIKINLLEYICLFLLFYFISLFIPIIIYLYRNTNKIVGFQTFYFSLLFFSFLIISFLFLNIFITVYKNKRNTKFKTKLYFLYLFNIDIFRKKLNNILYGKKRTYNLGEKKAICLYPYFQKLNITWCLLVKYLIPFFFIFIFSSNSICNIHDIFISNKYSEGSKTEISPKNEQNVSNTLSNRLRINNNTTLKTGENTNLNVFINKEDEYKKQNLMNETIKKNKYKFGMLIQYIVSIIMIIIICLFSVAPFINPKNLSIFVLPLTHIWNINDIQIKKKKPINYLYTRYIFFFEEILPCDKIMPFYVWKHVKKHIKNESFIISLKQENENNPNINDKSYTNMNKDNYEKYILDLIGTIFKSL